VNLKLEVEHGFEEITALSELLKMHRRIRDSDRFYPLTKKEALIPRIPTSL